MSPLILVPAMTVGLFLGMLACLEIGYRIGRRAAPTDASAYEGLGAIEAAIFALLGLLLGFAFAGAVSRLDARRQLIVQEANAVGTAYLRLDLLPPSDQPDLRRLFRDYLEARFRVSEAVDVKAADRFIAQAVQLQQQIWARVVAAGRLDQTQNTTRVALPAINEMIDVTTVRTVAARTRLPGLVLVLLFVIALLSALTAGYAMAKRKRRSVLHDVLYAAAVATTVYVVLDLDNPRIGLIRLDATDKILHDLHDSIGK
jgi:hypothetical protein